MEEILDIFTKDGTKIGSMSKKDYYSQKSVAPWIKCCSCFVVDRQEKKVLFEKRGNTLIDSGKVDLCSGHVQSGEIPQLAMMRELKEELGIPENISSNVHYLGDVFVDCSNLSDPTNRKNMKFITSMYALDISYAKDIKMDNDEVVRFAWLSQEDAIGFIENSMTRIPYDEKLKEQYDAIFQKLDFFMQNKKNHTIDKI